MFRRLSSAAGIIHTMRWSTRWRVWRWMRASPLTPHPTILSFCFLARLPLDTTRGDAMCSFRFVSLQALATSVRAFVQEFASVRFQFALGLAHAGSFRFIFAGSSWSRPRASCLTPVNSLYVILIMRSTRASRVAHTTYSDYRPNMNSYYFSGSWK